MKSRHQSFSLRILLTGAVLVTCLITPNTNFDPVGVTKMTALVFVAFGLIAFMIFTNSAVQFSKEDVLPTVIYLIFLILISFNLVINSYALEERIYGVSQRNNGWLTNLSLALCSILAFKLWEVSRFRLLVIGYGVACAIVTSYFLLQLIGIDFFSYQNFYGAPSSTLGNPNFVSGFLGISSLSWLLLGLSSKAESRALVPGIVLLILGTFAIYQSASIQGFLAILVVLIVFFLGRLFAKSLALFICAAALSSFALLTIYVGFLGLGPFGIQLKSSTLLARIEYWRTAVEMLEAKPLVGVGLDGYGDYFRLYRDDSAISRLGESQVSDSPHNLFLDYFAGGGAPLGFTFLALFFLAFKNTVVSIRISKISAPDQLTKYCALLALLCGFAVQSLFSPFSIGIAIWGWIIIGCCLASPREQSVKSVKGHSSKKESKQNVVLKFFLGLATLLLPALATVPAVHADSQFLQIAKLGDGEKIAKHVVSWPRDTKRIILVATGLTNGGNQKLAKIVTLKGLEHNPNSYELWRILRDNPVSNQLEITLAETEMKRLNDDHQ